MIDENPDNQIDETFDKIKIDYGSVVMENPRHPEYSEDRVFAGEGIIAVMDGVGSGGQDSAKAAETVQRKLAEIGEENKGVPNVLQAEIFLRSAIFEASNHIKHWRRITGGDNVDTTLAMGMICRSADNQKNVLLTANAGDSRIYRYVPETGVVEQITEDHSIVQALVKNGAITPEEAFIHSQRNVITNCVGLLKNSNEIDFKTVDVSSGDIFLAVSDGVSDNIKPEDLALIIAREFSTSYDQSIGKLDLEKFTLGIANQAIENMANESLEYAKKDDVAVAALRMILL